MAEFLHWADVCIAAAIVIIVTILYVTEKISRTTFLLFWIGSLIGATWEFGFFLAGPDFSATPLFTRTSPWPLPAVLQPLLHTLWDGGILMAGLGVVRLLLPAPHFRSFRATELLVLLTWGQVQALSVEMIAIGGSLWIYEPLWWNPVILHVGGGHLTLAPQLVWLVASLVFYPIAIRLYRRNS